MAKIDSYSTATPSLTDLLLGTDSDSANATKDFIISSSVPALASSTGAAGQIAYDSTYIYVCVATDTWKRVAIATW